MGKIKNIDHYLKLLYKIEIEPISDKDGGGYTARLPQFGSLGIVGDGETVQSAIESLEAAKKIVFERLLQKGVKIPKPEHDIALYSGKILARMPKELHAKLIENARLNNVSLNHYMIYLLSYRVDIPLREMLKAIEEKIETCVSEIPERIYDKSRIFVQETLKKPSCADRYHEAA